MTSSLYKSLKEEAFEANLEIPARKLAIYTWGNVSAFDAERGVFAIKPSGVPYDALKVDDMVVLDLDGNRVEGNLNPSSDTPTHLELYRSFALSGPSKGKIAGITHTHSSFATSFAQALKHIPLFGTTHADHAPYGVVCTEFLSKQAVQSDYEKETGVLICKTFAKPPASFALACSNANKIDDSFSLVPHENPWVLVGGHGPFTWGENAKKSVYNAAVLEEVAKMAYQTLQICKESAPLADYIVQKHYERKHGANAYYGQ